MQKLLMIKFASGADVDGIFDCDAIDLALFAMTSVEAIHFNLGVLVGLGMVEKISTTKWKILHYNL